MKIHKKLFSGIPFNFTLFCYIFKTTKNLKLKFWICNQKNMGFHLISKKYTTSGWTLGDENVIGIRAFKGSFSHLNINLSNFWYIFASHHVHGSQLGCVYFNDVPCSFLSLLISSFLFLLSYCFILSILSWSILVFVSPLFCCLLWP